MAHDVFLSHTTSDKLIADSVCHGLEAAGIRCWIAPRDVRPGTNWGAEITNAVKSARIFVLVFSASADSSRQVLNEITVAANGGLAILPFRVEEFALSPQMEYYLSASHWLDAITPPIERHIATLAEDIRALLVRRSSDIESAANLRSRDDGSIATHSTLTATGSDTPTRLADEISPSADESSARRKSGNRIALLLSRFRGWSARRKGLAAIGMTTIALALTIAIRTYDPRALREGVAEVSVDLNSINTLSAPQHVVGAAKSLLEMEGISIDSVQPATSNVVIANLSLLGSLAVGSGNLLTQVDTKSHQASFTLRFPEALDSLRFTLPRLTISSGKNGLIFPAWTATALDSRGTELDSRHADLLSLFQDEPARSIVLRAQSPDVISALRIESDGQGRAAYTAVLIERLSLFPRVKRR